MTIALLDGMSVDSKDIRFDSQNYHFFVGDNDITELIRRADKRALVPGFDDDIENRRVYAERVFTPDVQGDQPAPIGSTSTWGNFWNQVTTDPLDAPLDALDAGVKKLVASSGVQKIVIVAVIGLLIYGFIITRRR